MTSRIFFFVLLLTAGCARRYKMEGLILGTEPNRPGFLVSHRAITGVMPAMAMPVRVRNAKDLEGLAPGSRVRFTLVSSYARNIHIEKSAGVIKDGGDTIVLTVPKNKVALGQPVPDFTLTDQQSRVIRLAELRGRVVVVNFIYTRCPLPDVCPRLSATFARLQRRFPDQMGKDLALLSVTLDPTYDTPEVLARYASIWKAIPAGWHFLTGTTEEVQDVAGRFGLVYWPEEGLITHTSSTGIIGRDGRLAALVEGTSHTADQLGDLTKQELEKR
jgi:protein SCO1